MGRAKLTDFAWNADKSPHNLYLLVAAELGILGLLLFALLLFFTFKDLCFEKNLPLLSFGNILLAVLLVFLIEGFFRNHLYLHVFWIVLALAPVLRKKGLY